MQHTHPFANSTICSLLDTISSESIPTSPNSLTITPTRSPCSPVKTWLTNVVFPDPNAPVTIVTGILSMCQFRQKTFINCVNLLCFMKKVVLSVGGSLINPGKIDVKFLKSLRSLVRNKRAQFFIVCGGGKPAREYMSVASSFGVSSSSRDDVGIAATLLNAELVRAVLGATSVKQEPKKSNDRLVVAGGWKVGGSTDVDAVLWAKKNGVKEVINCTNVDFVYNKDPKKFGAKPFNWLSWNAYLNLISSKFVSGMHAPFDPVASRLAKKFKMKVIVLSGKNMSNLSKCIDGKTFVGTVIE